MNKNNPKSHWNELADMLGAPPPESAEPTPEPEQKPPIESATPPAPPRREVRTPASVAPNHWRGIAGSLGLEVPDEVDPPSPPQLADNEHSETDQPGSSPAYSAARHEGMREPGYDEERLFGEVEDDRRDSEVPPASTSYFAAPVFESDDRDGPSDVGDADPLVVPQERFLDEVSGDFESDSIDNHSESDNDGAEESSDDTGSGRRRRRRRRGRRGMRTEGDDSQSKVPSDQDEDEAGLSVRDVAVDGVEEADPDAEQESDARRGRRRRRRRRSSARDEGRETAAVGEESDDDDDDESSLDFERELATDTRGHVDVDDDDDDDEPSGDSETDVSMGKHRKIPTWAEAIDMIVTSNLAGRPKNPNASRGRGRSRRSDR